MVYSKFKNEKNVSQKNKFSKNHPNQIINGQSPYIPGYLMVSTVHVFWKNASGWFKIVCSLTPHHLPNFNSHKLANLIFYKLLCTLFVPPLFQNEVCLLIYLFIGQNKYIRMHSVSMSSSPSSNNSSTISEIFMQSFPQTFTHSPRQLIRSIQVNPDCSCSFHP